MQLITLEIFSHIRDVEYMFEDINQIMFTQLLELMRLKEGTLNIILLVRLNMTLSRQ